MLEYLYNHRLEIYGLYILRLGNGKGGIFMKKREKRIEEHKSRGKEIVISPQDILKVLNKLTEILPDSGPEELTTVKSKIALQRKKLEKAKLVDQEKEQEIARLKQDIENIRAKIGWINNKEGVQLDRVKDKIKKSLEELDNEEKQLIIKSNPEQSEKIKALTQKKRAELNKELTEECEKIKALMQKKRAELNKKLTEKLEDFEPLENLIHKPLQPTEMIDALIYSPYRPNSLDEAHGSTAEPSTSELIDKANSLISIATTEVLKYKIDIRKDFLKTTKGKLPLLTKLPNKSGDKDNILSPVENLKKSFKGTFTYDHQLYAQLTNIFSSSLYLLIDLRGQLKLWENPSKYIKIMTDKGSITKTTKQVETAKSRGKLFSLLKGQNLTNLAELIKNVESLTKDYSLFYGSIIAKNSPKSLISELREHRKSLQEQIDFHHKFFQEFRGESPTTFAVGKKYHGDLSQILITSWFDTEGNEGEKPALSRASSVYSVEHSLTSIILEYLGIIPSFFGGVKYYQKQIEYTDIAITWLNFSTFYRPAEKQSKVSGSLDVAVESEFESDYLRELEKYEFNQKLSLLLEIKEKLEIVDKFILKEKSERPYLKYALETLDLIQIDFDSGKFLKIYSRPKSDLEFIQGIVDLVIYIIEFLSFPNIKILNQNGKYLNQQIEVLEKYLTETFSLKVKKFIETNIVKEELVLDNVSYLINYKTSKALSSKLESHNLLEFLTRLIDHTQCTPEKLLNKQSLTKSSIRERW